MAPSETRSEESEQLLLEEAPVQSERWSSELKRSNSPFLLTFYLLIYTSLVAGITATVQQRASYVAKDDPFKWTSMNFKTSIRNSTFAGKPNPALDHAWHELLESDNIRLPKESVGQGVEGIGVAGTSDMVVQLATFHSLHCLKKARQLVYKEYYYPDADDTEIVFQQGHVDHCIEYIREMIMCKADKAVIGLHWINGSHRGPGWTPTTSRDTAPHRCVDWDEFSSWADERRFDLSQFELLVPPGN